jgi:hypothetical protein
MKCKYACTVLFNLYRCCRLSVIFVYVHWQHVYWRQWIQKFNNFIFLGLEGGVLVVQWLSLGEENCSYGSGCRGFKVKCGSITQKVREQVSKSKVHFLCSYASAEYVLASQLARDSAPYLTIFSIYTLSYYYSRIIITFGVVYPEILSRNLMVYPPLVTCTVLCYFTQWPGFRCKALRPVYTLQCSTRV